MKCEKSNPTKAELRAASRDIKRKVKSMLRDRLKTVDALVDQLAASGAAPLQDHIANESNWSVPKCVLCALLSEWASPRGYGPSRRVYVTRQDREWQRRIRNYEAML